MFKFLYQNINFAYKIDNADDPADEYCPHSHPLNELIYFINGNISFTVDETEIPIEKGSIVFVPAGVSHYAIVDKSISYERYVLKFSNSVLPDFINEKLQNMQPYCGKHTELQSQFMMLSSYYNQFENADLYELFVCELIKIIILLCKTSADEKNQYNEILSPMLSFIDENICSKIDLQTLNDEFHYSKSYIVNMFKKYLKIPPIHYIRKKKIIAADAMLLTGKKKCDVAELLGFNDYSSFYRAYVKEMGHPPFKSKN